MSLHLGFDIIAVWSKCILYLGTWDTIRLSQVNMIWDYRVYECGTGPLGLDTVGFPSDRHYRTKTRLRRRLDYFPTRATAKHITC